MDASLDLSMKWQRALYSGSSPWTGFWQPLVLKPKEIRAHAIIVRVLEVATNAFLCRSPTTAVSVREHVDVLVAIPNPALTLTTCAPQYPRLTTSVFAEKGVKAPIVQVALKVRRIYNMKMTWYAAFRLLWVSQMLGETGTYVILDRVHMIIIDAFRCL